MNATPYPPKPTWPGPDSHNQPQVSNVRKGYDVTAVRYPDSRRAQAYSRANATLNDNNFQWPMFIHDVTIDLALSGNTAQAQMTRDFYPHNFMMPSFTIQGQALDLEDYGYLCEFIHQSQHLGVAGGGHLVQLWIKGNGYDGSHNAEGSRLESQRGVSLNGKFIPNEMVRGSHHDVLCQGWVGTMPRQHERGVISPMYTFQFVAVEMLDGPYQEALVDTPTPQDWHALLNNVDLFQIDHKLKWNNWWILNWAKHNSQNIFNTNAGSV